MDTIEIIKKLGAGLVIVILSIMMLIMFSSQKSDDIVSIVSGQAKFGRFNGKDIQPDIYYWTKDYCKRSYEQYGNIPEQFINNCASEQLKQLYTLSSMGSKMGIRTSRKTIETNLAETIKQLRVQQDQFMDPDDRLSVEELYRRELIQSPISTRMMLASAGLTANVLSGPIPVPSSLLIASRNTGDIKFNFKLVRYSTADLLKTLGTNIEIPESEIKAEYDRKERLKEGKDLSSYEEQKELIANELKTARKQKELGNIKKELSEMKSYDLQKISKLTHAEIIQLKNVALKDLQSVPSQAGPVNLSRAEILSNPAPGTYGPFQDGEFTVYAEITDILTGSQTADRKDLKEIEKDISTRMGNKLYYFLIDNEARIGKFVLNPALSQAESQF